MRLIFLGDVNVDRPRESTYDPLSRLRIADLVMANLEGALCDPMAHDQASLLGLCNSLDILPILNDLNVRAVCLANNHMYDFSLPVHHSVQTLRDHGIDSVGAGCDLGEASRPISLANADASVKIFAFGWDVIGCRFAKRNREGVNPLSPNHLFSTIRALRRFDEASCVVFVMHWNYELELFPQPAHRQLAHALIDAGVDAVVGLHPHVAQGVEMYADRPIVYSLGNWYFPQRQLGSFKLSFPPIASRELALELMIIGRQVTPLFHWHQFDQTNNQLHFESSENINGPIVRELTPFAGLPHDSYIKWFRAHRTRRRGLPIYRKYENAVENWLKDRYVGLRHGLIAALVRSGIKQSISG